MAQTRENPGVAPGLPNSALIAGTPEVTKSHPKNQAITVSNWRPFAKGTKVGTFDLTLPLRGDGPGLKLHGCMLHRHSSGKAWLALPAREFVKHDKSIGFANLISFVDPGIEQKLKDGVLPLVLALEAECSR